MPNNFYAAKTVQIIENPHVPFIVQIFNNEFFMNEYRPAVDVPVYIIDNIYYWIFISPSKYQKVYSIV